MDTTELAAEVAAIERRMAERKKRYHKAARHDQQLVWMLRRKIHAITIRQLEGKPNAVRVKERMPAGHQTHHLNDVTGTVTKCKRTRCFVAFDNGESWDMLIESVAPVTEPQGEVFGFVDLAAR